MAEFVEKRCEDMIPELEQMKGIKLFNKNEIRSIAKKLKEWEYKIQRRTKCKEDYLRYIQYEMDLLKLIKQRRQKYCNTQKKSDIDFAIANKMNSLYKDAIYKFQDDIRFWMAYIKFCKHMHFHNNISSMLNKMLEVHRDKAKCWHIAACWELEENKNKQSARQILLRGLRSHPMSQLLYIDAFKLELHDTVASGNNTENQKTNSSSSADDNNEMSLPLKRAYMIYQQAFERIKDIKFILKFLDATQEREDTEKLQNKIISDVVQEYAYEPLMWDMMARRELQGLMQPGNTDTSMEVDGPEQTSLRDRITSCNEVFQTAVKKLKSEMMWSLYIECLLEINYDLQLLPNFKKKLLKIALMQAHQAKKLKEKYYIKWITMLSVNDNKDENVQKKLEQILCEAVDAIPNSVSLWHLRTRHLLISGREEEAAAVFSKATKVLEEKALPLWRMRILHVQTKIPEKMEETFQAALRTHQLIASDVKPAYIEWLVLMKSIHAARKAYEELSLQPPITLEFHKKMAALELTQPRISQKYARRPYEMATQQYGSNDISIWMDYIKFEMDKGDSKKVGEIHARAVKTLKNELTQTFIEDYSRFMANLGTENN